jgi:hypothetical protein
MEAHQIYTGAVATAQQDLAEYQSSPSRSSGLSGQVAALQRQSADATAAAISRPAGLVGEIALTSDKHALGQSTSPSRSAQ